MVRADPATEVVTVEGPTETDVDGQFLVTQRTRPRELREDRRQASDRSVPARPQSDGGDLPRRTARRSRIRDRLVSLDGLLTSRVMRIAESVDALSNRQRDTQDRQCGGPGDQDDGAGAGREEVVLMEAHERLRSTVWHEPSNRGGEAEEEIVNGEAPGEQRDDRPDLVVDDRSETGADRAPQGPCRRARRG